MKKLFILFALVLVPHVVYADTTTTVTNSPVCTNLSTSVSQAAGTPQIITLSCTGTTTNGTITGAQFTFGDGQTQLVQQSSGASGSTITVSHTYNQIGSLGASCRIQDSNNTFSDTPAVCKHVIYINPAVATTSPTPIITTAPTINSSSPSSVYITPAPATPIPTAYVFPTITPAATQTNSSSFPWWLVGVGLAILGVLILFLHGKKSKNPPPPQTPPPPSVTPPQNPLPPQT